MQPTNTPPNMQPNAQPRPGITIRGRRFTLPWVIGSVVAVLVILSCGCCGTVTLASALNGGNGAQATATSGQAGAQAQATHAPKATATPQPTPLTGKDVTHLTGAGNGGHTEQFTVQGTWGITWGCQQSYSDTLMISVVYDGPNDYAPDGLTPPTIHASCPKDGTQGSQVYHDAGGQYTISVISGAAWYVNVIDVAG